MNIFVTSPDPVECARYLDDKRVVKMCLESAQILSTIMTRLNHPDAPYRPTHEKHPCVLWAGEHITNYTWLLGHFIALCEEYTARYNKTHKCASYIPRFKRLAYSNGIVKRPTEFVNCTPYKNISNVYHAYQLCLNDKWDTDKRQPTWYGETK